MVPATIIAALAAGLGMDYLLGDPANRYHPVAWLGRLIGFAVPKLKARTARSERARGAGFALAITVATGLLAYFVTIAGIYVAGVVGAAIISAFLLKATVAVRGMEKHAQAIMDCLESGDREGARRNLSLIVRRSTADLSEQHILSATIECVSESTVDGITGPIFYFSLLGPAGAVAYRTINTLDSMVGYRDEYFGRIGWMSARLDTAANFLPARLTAIQIGSNL